MECPATPPFVRILGDVKKRRKNDVSPHFTNLEKESVVGFAIQWLQAEPIRSHFIVYLSDMKWIQFFCVSQHNFSIIESPVLDLTRAGSNWLAGLLTASNEAVGYPSVLHMVSFNNEKLTFDRFLGRGASGVVYAAGNLAVKLFLRPADANTEYSILCNLHKKIDKLKAKHNELKEKCKGLIPRMGEFYLSDDATSICFPYVGYEPKFLRDGFSALVDILHLFHICGFVHRDVRPSNLIIYHQHLLLIDFGSMCQRDVEQEYLGTMFHASDRILRRLRRGQTDIAVSPVDDLHSLVRTARDLLAVDKSRFKEELHSNADSNVCRKHFWSAYLTGMIYFYYCIQKNFF